VGDQSQNSKQKKDLHSRVVCSVNEAGAYITAKRHAMDTYLLIDTVPTVSLLSKPCYENIQGEEECRQRGFVGKLFYHQDLWQDICKFFAKWNVSAAHDCCGYIYEWNSRI
jgi:hypothetical protein